MILSTLILVVTCVINIALAIFVFIKNKKSSNNSVSLVFILSILSLVGWSICNYLADTSITTKEALFWTKATFPTSLWMGWSIVYFSSIFPTQQKNHKKTTLIYACLIIFFSCISMGSLIIREVTLTPSVGISDVEVGDWYQFIALMYLILITHSTFNFIKNYRKLTGIPKSQVKYILIGWTTFLSTAFIVSNILPLLTGDASWSKFGPMSSIIMSISIAYAIVRYQFLDIKIIIQRGLIYSVLLSTVTAMYLSLVFIFEFIFNKSNNMSVLASALITTFIGIFGVQPLKAFFQKITDPIFFKGEYDYVNVLNTLTDILNKNIILDVIVTKSSDVIKKSLRVRDVTFSFKKLIRNKENCITFPIVSNGKNVGYLHLEEKLSGDSYTTKDIQLLENFTNQAAIAIEKASLYTQIQDYAKTLEKKVEDRTSEILKIQKDQEVMMLEISHGLQTPLTIMKGELFFLRKQGYDTPRIDIIDTSIDKVSSFITRLLSLSHLETNISIKKTNINISTLTERLVLFFKQATEEKNITLSSSIESDIFVDGNKEELEELISNLINNAIKYTTPSTKKEIYITLSQNKNQVSIAIQDTGVGIREENIPKLFEKFYRIKSEETKGIRGTGLGLVICKKIAEMHGGSISIKSTFGEGSTFTIILPATEQKTK